MGAPRGDACLSPVPQSGRPGCAAAWPCRAPRGPPNWPTSRSKPKTCGRSPASPCSCSRSWATGSSGKCGWVGPGGRAGASGEGRGKRWGHPQAWHPPQEMGTGSRCPGAMSHPLLFQGTPSAPRKYISHITPYPGWGHEQETKPGLGGGPSSSSSSSRALRSPRSACMLPSSHRTPPLPPPFPAPLQSTTTGCAICSPSRAPL